jgi:crotonobetainyl-CoA:carnitine CoA-transferase CaiB-like acyl-CoA transferase
MAHPHLRERGTVRRVTDDAIGEFDIPGLAAKFSRWEPSKDLAAAPLGADNEDVLHGLLGLGDAEISQLYSDKTLVRDPLIQSGHAETQHKLQSFQ